MSLQLEWQYLQGMSPELYTLMGPIEEALREKFFPALFGEEEISADFRKILGHRVNHGGLGIPEPRFSVECAYNTSKAASRELEDSLLGGSVLNCLGHRSCVRKARQTARRSKMSVDLSEVFRLQDLAGGQEKSRLHRATRNEAWLSAVPHRITERSCLGRNSGIIFTSDMSWCRRTSPRPVMVIVRSFQ